MYSQEECNAEMILEIENLFSEHESLERGINMGPQRSSFHSSHILLCYCKANQSSSVAHESYPLKRFIFITNPWLDLNV